jgi:DNA topoisomerase-1
MMKLLIVESPSKCAKIESYLGPGFKCVASCGHIREIANGLADINHRFEPKFTLIPDKKAQVAKLKQAAKAASQVLLATDDDREGEAIAWHIAQVLDLPIATTPRIVFHEITQPALRQAVTDPPRTINMALVKAQQARQVLDLVVGFKVSPLLWRALYPGLSAGRCQTPTLRLVYDNDVLQKKSAVEIKYRVVGTFFPSFPMELDHEFDTPDQSRDFLQASIKHKHTVSLLPQRELHVAPPQPLTTSRLLQVANNVLRSSPKQTMMSCQTLYQQGLITYMRTDSTTYSATFLQTVAQYLDANFPGHKVAAPGNPSLAAHEAIRVTDLSVKDLSSKEAAMYRLIWRITLESCMAPAHYHVFPMRVSAPKDLFYKADLKVPVSLGWQSVVSSKDHYNDTPILLYVKQLKTAAYQQIRCIPAARFTHAHYTEASLVKQLEEMGIGRPSTYATLVDTIQERGYVKRMDVKGTEHRVVELVLRQNDTVVEETESTQVFGQEKNKLVLQPTGQECVEFLMQHFSTLFAYEYTQQMEQELDQIAQSENDGTEMCRRCAEDIDRITATSSSVVASGGVVSQTGELPHPAGARAILCQIDAEHALVLKKNGLVIEKRVDGSSVAYINVKKDVDVTRAKRGEYTLDDLIQPKEQVLGSFEGRNVVVVHGRYGPYVEWNGEKKKVPGADVTLEQVVALLQHRAPPQQKGVLRSINTDCSVREGKFGPYIYYKTAEMKNPKFHSLRGFADWSTASDAAILAWMNQ